MKLSDGITRQELIDFIEIATENLVICVPDNDYYARDYDWSKQTIRFVNPLSLIRLLSEE